MDNAHTSRGYAAEDAFFSFFSFGFFSPFPSA
jgi:hypothetical protein